MHLDRSNACIISANVFFFTFLIQTNSQGIPKDKWIFFLTPRWRFCFSSDPTSSSFSSSSSPPPPSLPPTHSKDSFYWPSHRGSRPKVSTPPFLTYFLHTSNGKHHFFNSCLGKSNAFLTFLVQKRSNVIIISSNAPRSLKRLYSKRKCTSNAQTLV